MKLLAVLLVFFGAALCTPAGSGLFRDFLSAETASPPVTFTPQAGDETSTLPPSLTLADTSIPFLLLPISTHTRVPSIAPTPTLPSTLTFTPTLVPTDTMTPQPTQPLEHYISDIRGHHQFFPLGCETAAAKDWANYFGKDFSEYDFQSHLPVSDNPDDGFVGSVYGPWGQVPPYA